MTKTNIACIIDDDPISVLITKKIMQRSNFCNSLLVYSDGEKAISGLTDIIASGIGIPEVILLDLNMPVMNGWEFLEKFADILNEKKITIFIVTSSINPSDLKKAKNYQTVSNYIVKPITDKALIQMSKKITPEQ